MGRTGWVLRLPPWLGWSAVGTVLVGLYLPVAMTVVYSFNASRIGTVWTGFSLDGYRTLWHQSDLWWALGASCLVGLAASTLSVAGGTLAALGLRRWPPVAQRIAQGLLALPLVTPDLIMALALAMFYHALGVRQGWLTVVAAHGVFGLAYAYIVMAAAVADLDETLWDAALDCGATPWQAACRVLLPILLPSLAVAWLLVFALSFDDFLITFLTKGAGTDTLPIKIYGQMRFGIKPQTSALFTLLLVVTLSVALASSRLARREPAIPPAK
jgi:spermidine/putrescine transport system permease protein